MRNTGEKQVSGIAFQIMRRMDLPSDQGGENWIKAGLGMNFRASFPYMEYELLAKHSDGNFQKEAGIGPFTVG